MSKKKKKKTEGLSLRTSEPVSIRDMRSRFRGKYLLVIFLLGAVALMGYANTFRVPFQFDDNPNIVENPSIRLKTLSTAWLGQLISQNSGSIRFFSYFTFALNYYFGGLNVFGYHLVNFLIHMGSGLVLYWFLLLTFRLPSLRERYGDRAFPIALFSSLLFLCHPVQTQSVTYIVQRMASMAGFLYLLAMALYVKGRLASGTRRYLFFGGMFLTYLLGLFTKENVAILPLFIALYEFYFFQGLEVGGKGRRALVYAVGFVAVIGLLMVLVWGRRYAEGIIEGYKIRDFTLVERVLTQFRVVLYYVTLVVWPHPSRLNLDYDFPTSHGLFDPATTLISILIVAGLVGWSIWRAKKRPVVSYFIFWYFGNLLIESSVFPLEMVYEHRLYLPVIGPIVLFVVLIVKGWEKIQAHVKKSSEFEIRSSEQRPPNLKGGSLTPTATPVTTDYPVGAILLGVTVFLLICGSYDRNKIWRDPITLWEDCLGKSPNKPRSHTNLGFYLIQDNQVDKGVEHYKIALKLNPKFEDAHFNLAQFYGERKQFDQAEIHLKECIRLAPNDPRGYNEMGLIQLKKKNFDEAVRFLKEALNINSFLESVHANLGDTYLQTGRLDQAMSEYERALQLNPELSEVHFKMAEVYTKKGQPELASEEFEKAVKAGGTSYEAHSLRGATYLEEGKVDEGIAELKEALKMNPSDPQVYNNLGLAYREKKMLDEAFSNYRKALEIDPSYVDPRVNLTEIYLLRGRINEAISELQEVLRLDPNKAEVHNNLGVIFLRKKSLNEAISCFNKALAINPKYGDACFNLALAYYYRKDIPAASSYAKKAVELGYPVDPRLLKALHISP